MNIFTIHFTSQDPAVRIITEKTTLTHYDGRGNFYEIKILCLFFFFVSSLSIFICLFERYIHQSILNYTIYASLFQTLNLK